MRTIPAVILAWAALQGATRGADKIVAYDGSIVRGDVLQLVDGRLKIRAEGQSETKLVALGDITSVKLVPRVPDPETFGSRLIIDNDGYHGPTEKSGKVKLKKGLHWFTILYFQSTQGASLSLSWEGPGIKKTEVPQNAIVKWNKNYNEIKRSPGLDEDGFRLPDELESPLATAGYKLYEWSDSSMVSELADLRDLPLKKYGTSRTIGLDFAHAATNFGLNFYGLIKAPRDGEYTFSVKSDDGTQMYIGRIPPIAQPSLRLPTAKDWSITLADNGHLDVPVTRWNETGPDLTFKVGGNEMNMNVPREHVRELWTRDAADGKVTVDRSGEPTDQDTVYAKNAEGQIQQVSGTVQGIEEAALKFKFQEQERSIKLDRIVGIVMRQPAPNPEDGSKTDPRVRVMFDLVGPNQFVGHLAEMSTGSVAIELPWGESFRISRNVVYRMTILNGRMQSLQDITPSEVAQTPFFNSMLKWQSGQSLTGETLQIGEKTYQKGLCLHSRTRLTYDIDEQYERFQCDLGLQHPDGQTGNAAVRITADGTELFVAEEVTAADDPRELNLDLSGKSRLTLEVDFGERMHIGDHVVFGNARLLRPELAP